MAPAVCSFSDTHGNLPPGKHMSTTQAPPLSKPKCPGSMTAGACGTFEGKLSVLMPKAAGRGRGFLGGNGVPCKKQTEGKVIGLALSQPRSCHTMTGTLGRRALLCGGLRAHGCGDSGGLG